MSISFLRLQKVTDCFVILLFGWANWNRPIVGMTVMAKVITTLEICENAKMARDMALTGLYTLLIESWMQCFLSILIFAYSRWHCWRQATMTVPAFTTKAWFHRCNGSSHRYRIHCAKANGQWWVQCASKLIHSHLIGFAEILNWNSNRFNSK